MRMWILLTASPPPGEPERHERTTIREREKKTCFTLKGTFSPNPGPHPFSLSDHFTDLGLIWTARLDSVFLVELNKALNNRQ